VFTGAISTIFWYKIVHFGSIRLSSRRPHSKRMRFCCSNRNMRSRTVRPSVSSILVPAFHGTDRARLTSWTRSEGFGTRCCGRQLEFRIARRTWRCSLPKRHFGLSTWGFETRPNSPKDLLEPKALKTQRNRFPLEELASDDIGMLLRNLSQLEKQMLGEMARWSR
jgi:hypothetical protein